MRRHVAAFILLLPLGLLPQFAHAQESGDDDKEQEGGDEKSEDESDDELDFLKEEDELDDLQFDDEDEGDLLDETIDEDTIDIEGQDTATIYRAYQEDAAELAPDEEILAWERYLGKYPESLFRSRIEKRSEELLELLYEEGLDRTLPGRLDADKRQLRLAPPLQLETINPRTALQAGFEWGLPDYMNLLVDYEHAFRRDFSFHAGIRKRYTGWSVEPGVRWAIIKSSRTKSLLAVVGDLHMNLAPFYVGFRPQLGFGQKIGPVDLQLQVGTEIEPRSVVAIRLLGGANVTYHATDKVGAFLETNLHMKNLAWEGGPFRFNVLSFGMTFEPLPAASNTDLLVMVGASVPYTSNYWMYHYGSIMAKMTLYLPE